MRIEQVHWHSLLPGFLGQESKVLDLGANRGEFARAIVKRFDCHCVAVEPSPLLAAGMFRDSRVTIVAVAVAARSGEVELFECSQSTASSITHRPEGLVGVVKVPTVRLEELVASLGWSKVDLLKCDVEGAELEVFESCSDEFLATVSQISVEFHDFNGMYSSSRVKSVLKRFHRLGFWSVRMSRIGHQDTLLVNHKRCPTSMLFRARTRVIDRNWIGVCRVAARWRRRARDHSTRDREA